MYARKNERLTYGYVFLFLIKLLKISFDLYKKLLSKYFMLNFTIT
jgi:hypothetical protein